MGPSKLQMASNPWEHLRWHGKKVERTRKGCSREGVSNITVAPIQLVQITSTIMHITALHTRTCLEALAVSNFPGLKSEVPYFLLFPLSGPYLEGLVDVFLGSATKYLDKLRLWGSMLPVRVTWVPGTYLIGGQGAKTGMIG